MSALLFDRCILPDNLLGNPNTVHCGTHNASRIACTLSTGVQSLHPQRLKALGIAGDAHRRRGSGLHAGHHRIGIGKARQSAVKAAQSLLEHLVDGLRRSASRTPQEKLGAVAACERSGAAASR